MAPERRAWLWLVGFVGFVLLSGLLVHGISLAGRNETPDPITSIGVHANQGWQQSDVTLRQGARFRIDYLSGRWTYWEGTIPLLGVDGDGYRCSGAACCEPLPQAQKGALIGKIGQDIFVVGHGGSFTASANAPLFLRINDCDGSLADNAGLVKIRITR
jgi:hypothetical protein